MPPRAVLLTLLLTTLELEAQPASSFLAEALPADGIAVGIAFLERSEGHVGILRIEVDRVLAGLPQSEGDKAASVALLDDESVLHRPRIQPGERALFILASVGSVGEGIHRATSVLSADDATVAAVAAALALPAEPGARTAALVTLVAEAPEPLAERLVVDLAVACRAAPPALAARDRLRARLAGASPGGKLFFVLGPLACWFGDDAAADVMLDALEKPGGHVAALALHAAFANATMTAERRARLHAFAAAADASRRAAALGILAGHVTAADRDVIVAAVRDSSPSVRTQAARAMGRLAEPALVPVLEGMLADQSLDVRRRVLGALAQLEAWGALRRASTDAEDPETRRLAARVLARPFSLPR